MYKCAWFKFRISMISGNTCSVNFGINSENSMKKRLGFPMFNSNVLVSIHTSPIAWNPGWKQNFQLISQTDPILRISSMMKGTMINDQWFLAWAWNLHFQPQKLNSNSYRLRIVQFQSLQYIFSFWTMAYFHHCMMKSRVFCIWSNYKGGASLTIYLNSTGLDIVG